MLSLVMSGVILLLPLMGALWLLGQAWRAGWWGRVCLLLAVALLAAKAHSLMYPSRALGEAYASVILGAQEQLLKPKQKGRH